MISKTTLLDRLAPFHQEHLLACWDALTDSQREKLAAQIDGIDFARLATLYENRDHLVDVAALVDRAKEPPAYKLESDDNSIKLSDAVQAGRDALAAGKVAVLVVAGGQGTRLGFDHPKGMFPIGPVGDTTLFQIHVEKNHRPRPTIRAVDPLLRHDQPGNARRNGRIFRKTRTLRAVRIRLARFLPRNDARRVAR